MSTGNGKGTIPGKVCVPLHVGPLLPGAPQPLDPWPFWKFPALTSRTHVRRGPPPSPSSPPKISRRSLLAPSSRHLQAASLPSPPSPPPLLPPGLPPASPLFCAPESPRAADSSISSPFPVRALSPTSDFFVSPGRSPVPKAGDFHGFDLHFLSSPTPTPRPVLSWVLRPHAAAREHRGFELWAELMASVAQAEVKLSSFPVFLNPYLILEFFPAGVGNFAYVPILVFLVG